MNTSRRLAAIMFTDIVGYTAMMQQDEKQGLAAVKLHEELLNRFVPFYEGKIHNLMGDGSLCIFPSAISAVKCARAIQLSLQASDYVPLRIGIHLGEVTTEDTKAYGDGVNVASRIEGSGHAGVILFSKSVHTQIANQADLASESMGMFQFKNVAKPMEIFALKDDRLAAVEPAKLKNKFSSSAKRKWQYVVLAGVLLVLLFTALVKPGWFLNSPILIPTVQKDLIAVAVFPFKTSDHESIRDLGEGMMDLLYSKFISLEGMTCLDPIFCAGLFKKYNGDVSEIMSLPGILQNDIDYAIYGSVMNIGGVIKFIGNLMDNKGEILLPVEVESDHIDQLNQTLETFSRQLLSRIMDRSKRDFSSLAVTTTDFEALKEYWQGEHARRDGNFSAANGHFLKAVNLDSTFVMGWLRLLNTNLSSKFRDPVLVMKCSEMVNRYADQLPQQFQEFVKAHNLVTEGNILSATKTLKNTLEVYGDNSEVLLLLGNVMFFTNIFYNRDMEESMEYFDRIFEHSGQYLEAEFLALWIALYKNDRDYIQYYVDKYGHLFKQNVFDVELSLYQKYLDGHIEKESIDSIRPLVDKNWNLVLKSLMALKKLDLAFELFDDFIAEMGPIGNPKNIKNLECSLLFIRGEFREAFNKFPNLAGRFYFGGAGQYDKNFQPIGTEMVESLLTSLETNKFFNPENDRHFTSRSIYRLRVNDLEAVEQDITELQNRWENANSESDQRITQYNLLRLKAYLARNLGDFDKVHLYLDTLYRQAVHLDDFSDLYQWFYAELKFMEADMYLEEDDLTTALGIYENMDKLGYFETPVIYHAPVNFRLGYIYDMLGQKKEAYERFKYFVAIYSECDLFYQENVQYARDKITAYENIE